jgi:hypothetical protein
MLQERPSEVRNLFDFSASDNLIRPSLPILLSAFHESEIKQVWYCGE